MADFPDLKFHCEDKNVEDVLQYIHQFWRNLIKESPPYTKDQLFYLPYPYVVPGGVYQQLFYWDSYFMILGLKVSRLDPIAKAVVENFLYEMKTFGIVPNSSMVAHLSRSQPPFLTSAIKEVWGGDEAWLSQAYQLAKIEYWQVWMDPHTHYQEGIGLNKYFDNLEGMLLIKGEDYLHDKETYIPPLFWQERTEAESGWDYTGRFQRQCGYFIPVDLNALLYKYEVDFHDMANRLGLIDEAKMWKDRASQRKKLMDQYLWNEVYGMYFDFHFTGGYQYIYPSLATFFPLWAGVADHNQALKVRNNLELFLQPGGVVTSTYYSGFQWDYPNGWAPLHWITVTGLKNYGFVGESVDITKRWIHLCTEMFLRYDKLYEKYNVVESNLNVVSRYPLQEGFGWTNAIYEKLAVDVLACEVEMASKSS